MKKSTLCFCIKEDEVLLAMKKRGFGSGKWNGYGGKVLDTEDVMSGAIRELKEESGLSSSEKDLKHVGIVRFYFDGKAVFECYVYITHKWEGRPIETEEMRPQWYKVDELPFEEMWAADARWIPLILGGRKIEARVNFNKDGSVVKEFEYKYVEN